MTTVQSPLPLNSTGYTLLLGYESDSKVFAGFDLNLHREFTAGPPSVQVGLDCIQQALQDGLAFHRKTNREIAVGGCPDQLLNYMINAKDIHLHGKNATMHRLLTRASSRQKSEQRDGSV